MSITRYTPRNLAEFRTKFSSDLDCYEYLFGLRRRMPFRCRREGCQSTSWRLMERRTVWGKRKFRVCKKCGFQESATTGTILNGSRLALKDWLGLAWCAVTQTGFSVSQLNNTTGRSLCIGFGSAATPYLCVEKIRKAMANVPKLTGTVHLGMTRVGHTQSCIIHNPKLIGIAIDSISSSVRLGMLIEAKPEHIVAFARHSITLGGTIYTSGWSGYNGLTAAGYNHIVSSPPSDLLESAFIADNRLAKVRTALNAWLEAIGWTAIDKRNLPGYLVEYVFRNSCSFPGGNAGFRFSKLVRQMLESRQESNQQVTS